VKQDAQRLLDARRTALCLKLQAQRLLIAQQLGAEANQGGSYPRSRTMRLLTHRPELIVRALGGLASLLRLR
jgi:hypothetical protein